MIKYTVTKSNENVGMVDVVIEVGTVNEETLQKLKGVNPNEFLANIKQQLPTLTNEITELENALKDKQQALQAAHSLITQLTDVIDNNAPKKHKFIDKLLKSKK